MNVSTASPSDLDGSRVTERVQRLNLAFARISMAMHEGEDSVGSLTDSFTGMVRSVETVAQLNPSDWGELQQAIRSRYSMREEQEMFEALLEGATTEEALDIVRKHVHERDIDDIERF